MSGLAVLLEIFLSQAGYQGVSRNCFLYNLAPVLTTKVPLTWLVTISLMMHGR